MRQEVRRETGSSAGLERRRAIMTAARQEFVAHGFTAASMRRIAAGANCSVSNLYEYFSHKDALFRSLADPIKAEFERYATLVIAADRQLSENREQSTAEVLERSKEMSRSLVRYVLTHRDDLRLLFFASVGSSLGDLSRDYTETYRSLSAAYFTDDADEGSRRIMAASPQLRSILFGQSLMYLLELIRSDIGEAQATSDSDLLVEFTFAGFNAVAHWWQPPG